MNYKNMAEILVFIDSNNISYMCQLERKLKRFKPYLLEDLEENYNLFCDYLCTKRGIHVE